MYKSLGLQVRRDDLTHDGFMRHWLEVHAPMSRGVDALRGYVLNEVLTTGKDIDAPLTHPQFGATLDGLAQLSFDTKDGLVRMAEAPAVQKWFSDGPNYVGLRTGFLTREHVVRAPDGTPGFKAFAFVRGAGDSLRAALERLTDAEAAGVVYADIEDVTGSTNLPNFEVPAVDAAVELWGRDVAAAKRAVAALAGALDGQGEVVSAIVVREIVYKKPPWLAA